MDFDKDGITDIISGSYDPGDIYLIRGLGKGEYAAVESILDEAGVPLVHHPVPMARYTAWQKKQAAAEGESNGDDADDDAEDDEVDSDEAGSGAIDEAGGDADPKRADAEAGDPAENAYTDDEQIQDRVASFGSWPEAIDWDNDGDLDLLIGSFGGEVWLRTNVGERSKPVFPHDSVRLEGDGGPIKVHGHADPVAADWDHDGLWDLVVGSDVGQVGWYRNLGKPSEPRFGLFEELVPAVAGMKFFPQTIAPGELPKPGARKQICVVDYNGDGWLDLIAGDHSDLKVTRELTDEEVAEQDAEQKVIDELAGELKPLGYEGEEGKRRQALMTRLFELDDAFNKKYFVEARTASFVWLYLRQPGEGGDVPSSTETQPETENAPDGSRPADGDTDSRDAEQGENDRLTFAAESFGPEQVQFAVRIVPDPDDPAALRLDVRAELKGGWHLCAPSSGTDDSADSGNQSTTVLLKLPDGFATVGAMQCPAGEPDPHTRRTRIIAGRAAWQQALRREAVSDGEATVVVTIGFQVCNDQFCLPADTLTIPVTIPD